MSDYMCAALSPQELAHHLRETLHCGELPFEVDYLVGTSIKRYYPRILSAANIPGAECGYIPDTRNGSSNVVCDMDYFIAYVAAHPTYRNLVKSGGSNNPDTLLILGTKEVIDMHGNPFYPLAWYTREKSEDPPTIHALRDIDKLAQEAICILLYREN